MAKDLKKIFISSIHQNAGKTTISLGLYQAFKELKFKTAFMKPVGQQVVAVGKVNIDKDSYLLGNVYHLRKYLKNMSPVTIPRGFTEKYISNPQRNRLKEAIEKSFQTLTRRKDAIIVEGTGHAGVGAVVDFSNADVAKLLGTKVIIISEGGIGRCIDEIILNKALFDLKGVEILGVIVNKVLPEKYEKIKSVLGRGLANKGIKLLGVIPTTPLLSRPTVDQIKDMLELKVLCGDKHLQRRVNHAIVAAMEPHNMIPYLKSGTLVLISGDRVDSILLAVSTHLTDEGKQLHISGVILTGGLMPHPKIVDLLKKSQLPVLITSDDTYTVAGKIERLICKIQTEDDDKIKEATRLVKKYVDMKTIVDTF